MVVLEDDGDNVVALDGTVALIIAAASPPRGVARTESVPRSVPVPKTERGRVPRLGTHNA
jgi:hypothetical protein